MPIEKIKQTEPFEWSRTLPRNLVESERWLFDYAVNISCSGISILVGKDILVDVMLGMAVNRLTTIEESLVFPDQYPTSIPYFKNTKFACRSWLRFALSPCYITSHPCLLIHDAACNNYGHWMTDAVSRLYYAKDLISSHKIILPSMFRKHKYKLESLIPFGVKEENIVYIDNQVILSKNFAMPSFMGPYFVNPKDEIVREIREIYHRFYNLSRPKQGTRLYISRAGASYRKVVNESQVIDRLLGKGFTVVYPEQLSFEEQVRLFASAEIVVGLTGAAFNNMMFMHSGYPVVEFRLENDNSNLHYFSYASAHELPYYYLSCKGDATDRTFANFFVDLDSLDTTVDMALSSHSINGFT
jgi:Glycosyltransferase 61